MRKIRIKDIGKYISLMSIEIVRRDQKSDNTSTTTFNIFVNLHQTDGTHWVLVIRREGGPVYYVDGFGDEAPPLFLKEYVSQGSNERIQQYNESFCGANCLYMIYLIDTGFKIKFAFYNLIIQVKCPGMHNMCLGLSGKNDCEVDFDIYTLRENPKPSRVLCSQMSGPTLRIKANDSLQSWLDDDNIIFNAIFSESFRSLIASPSE